jgi:AcrR family transcriptional regulator
MSLSSHSAGALRRIPQQQRGRLRVAGFLRVAATVFTEMGYDRATMSVIAERAHSSIGSLYQFFPNKKSLAQAIRAQYIKGIEQYWLALAEEAGSLDAEELACRLVTLQLEIVKKYPALLALLDVPPTTRTSKQREMIRSRIADVLTAHKCRLPGVTALRLAAVVQQVSRGLLMLYARTDPGQKPAIIEEFKSVLIGYLVPKLRS